MTVSVDAAIEHNAPVLVVGGGPAGLIAALQLARHGIKCILAERNLDTTKWPKMDITNCRSMELFNRLDIAQGLRDQGVGQDYSFNVLFSSGLSTGGGLIGKWELPSANRYKEKIKKHNDGSMPREPYQRCSQAIFEAWLKPRIQQEALINSHFGLNFQSLRESEDGVESRLIDMVTGEQHVVHSKYVIGCDGAGSRVRRKLGIGLTGGPVPGAMFLVHFKSRDFSVLQSQGQYWHIFFSNGGAIISQDEADTWTVHVPIGLDVDPEEVDADWAVARALGGSAGPCPCKIDRVLVKSIWRPNICIADHYVSAGGRVFLSGDAAHQNIPTGGYGMNTAVGDSFDIGWKLAAALSGIGGKHLLASYEPERRPVAIRNIERSGVHHSVHRQYINWASEAGHTTVIANTEEGRALRDKIDQFLRDHDGENKEHGIEMGYRNNYSPIVVPDLEADEPEWEYRNYIPSTWPGARAPHVYLADGETSIFDLFGPQYTIVDFSRSGAIASEFFNMATKLNVPLKKVHLPNESHVRKVWEREAVLIRPDDYVAWRAPLNNHAVLDPERILKIATGRVASEWSLNRTNNGDGNPMAEVPNKGFTATVGNVDQNNVAAMGVFQK